jgi:hypothetical protein
MYRFKGFVGIKSLISNGANTTSPVGELSAHASTFAKDVKQYASANNDVTVYGFSSKSSLTGEMTVPDVVLEKAFNIADWVFLRQRSIASSETKAEFRAAVVTQFGLGCANIDVGEMVVATNGKTYPASITWSNLDYGTDTNQHQLWFSDAAFRQQYDEYDIVVIPPLPNLDSFFSAYNDVLVQLNARSYVQTLEAIQTARAGYPETLLSAEEYMFQNVSNNTVNYKTNWSFLIYGPRGNDVDLIKAALIDYIRANSLKSLSVWRTIFPDIFKSTEFMIIPNWGEYAVQERVLTAGVYSPVTNLRKELDYLKRILIDYPPVHIENHACLLGYPYKSISLGIIGNIDNRENKYDIKALFPDIIAVSTGSTDFGRMSENTQTFMLQLSTMILVAEKMTEYTDLPTLYRKTLRNGVLYLTLVYNNVRYLVSTKLSTPAQ